MIDFGMASDTFQYNSDITWNQPDFHRFSMTSSYSQSVEGGHSKGDRAMPQIYDFDFCSSRSALNTTAWV